MSSSCTLIRSIQQKVSKVIEIIKDLRSEEEEQEPQPQKAEEIEMKTFRKWPMVRFTEPLVQGVIEPPPSPPFVPRKCIVSQFRYVPSKPIDIIYPKREDWW